MKKLLAHLIAIAVTSTAFAAQNTDSSLFYFQKGLEEKKAKRYLVASDHFTKAIAINAAYVDAYIENGYANNEMRRTDAAKADFVKFLTYSYASCLETVFHIEKIAKLYPDIIENEQEFISKYNELSAKIYNFIKYVEENWKS